MSNHNIRKKLSRSLARELRLHDAFEKEQSDGADKTNTSIIQGLLNRQWTITNKLRTQLKETNSQ